MRRRAQVQAVIALAAILLSVEPAFAAVASIIAPSVCYLIAVKAGWVMAMAVAALTALKVVGWGAGVLNERRG